MATARKLPSGNYRCRAYIGKDDNGANIYKSFTASTKAKAEKDAVEYVTRNVTVRSHGEFTFAMNKFMDSSSTLSPNTIRGYDSIRRMMIKNYNWFCKMDTDRIRKEDLQEVINDLSKAHTPKTVRNYSAFIHSVIELSGAIAPEVDLPEKIHPKYNIPDNETVKAVISLSKGTRLEVPIMLAAFGPMRRGEICALTLDDIDTENNIIHVSKAVAEDKDKNLIIKTPKTYSSDRYITYPKQVIELIMSQGYVVEMNPRSLSEAFRYFLEKNHIPHFRFHDLRHYCASSLHAIGIPDAYIMRRGGWKTDTVLKEVYRHTLTDQITPMDEKAVNQFDKLL